MTIRVGDVLATTARIWGRNLPRFFLLAVIFNIPVFGFWLLFEIDAVKTFLNEKIYAPLGELHPVLADEVVSGSWLLYALLVGAITTCVVARLRDEHASIWRGLALALRRAPAIVGAAFLVHLATTGLFIAIAILRHDRDELYRNTDWYEWLLVNGVGWVVVSSLVIVIVPAAAAERRGMFSAFARGFALAHGNRLRILAIVLVHQALLFGIYTLLAELTFEWVYMGEDHLRRFMIYAYVRLGLSVILSTLAATLAAVIYERARAAREGPTPNQLHGVFD